MDAYSFLPLKQMPFNPYKNTKKPKFLKLQHLKSRSNEIHEDSIVIAFLDIIRVHTVRNNG